MSSYRLTVLGYPALHDGAGDLVRIRTRKHLGLLIYLVLEPSTPHRRDKLATIFWPRVGIQEARHSLATAISMLRRAIGVDAFEVRADIIRLKPGRVTHDIAFLDGPEEEAVDFTIAARFLEEFDVPDAPDFLTWADGKRAETTPKIHRILSKEIDRARRHGNLRQVEAFALRLQRIDDLDEVGIRALIEVHAMSGDRTAALRTYERWKNRLSEEIGATPSRGIEDLVVRLKSGKWDPPAARIGSQQTQEPSRHHSFNGREREFALCVDAFNQIRHGQVSHVLIRGDIGVGKTALLDRLDLAASLDGLNLVRVQCHALERALPFAVIAGIVYQLSDMQGAIGTDPHHLSALAAIAPGVRAKFPRIHDVQGATNSENARLLFTEAFLGLLIAVAEAGPTALLIDDLHWADDASVAVLHLAIRRLKAVPVAIICAASTETANSGYLTAQFRDESMPYCTLVDLPPLTEKEAAAVLGSLLDSKAVDPGPAVRQAILRTAEGNPMALDLLVSDWVKRGTSSLALSLQGMTMASAHNTKESFRRILDVTITSLDDDTRSVGELAAILGHRMNEIRFYAPLDLSPIRIMSAMAHLTNLRILRDAGDHLEFASELIRSQCYHAMTALTRSILHGTVADRLLEEGDNRSSFHDLEIAWHLVRAGRTEAAAPWLISGGHAAIQSGAPSEADLAISTGLQTLNGTAQRAAQFILAEAKQEMGRWHDSLALLDGIDGSLTTEEASMRDLMQTVARRWVGYLATPLVGESTDLLLSIAESQFATDIRVRAVASTPYLLTQSRDHRRYERLRVCIDEMPTENLTPYQRLHLLLADAWLHNESGELGRAKNRLQECLSIIEKDGVGSSVALRVLIGVGTLEMVVGNYKEAVPAIHRAAQMAMVSHNTLQYGIAAASLATAFGRLGDHLEQGNWAEEALGCFRKNDWTVAAISSSYEFAMSKVFLEQYTEVRHLVPSIVERTSLPNCPKWAFQVCGLMVADIFIMTGSSGQAYDEAERATTGCNDEPLMMDFLGHYARWKALTSVRLGKPDVALAKLNDLARSLHRYHAKDQVELLASIGYLEYQIKGRLSPDLAQDIAARLAKLPPAIERLLRRTGVLDWRITLPVP